MRVIIAPSSDTNSTENTYRPVVGVGELAPNNGALINIRSSVT